jgi:hypothetical protein
MKATLERMPFGLYLGAPSVRVEIYDDDRPSPRDLAQAIAKESGPGVVCLHLARVPWAAPWWPEVLAEAQALLPTPTDAVGILLLEALEWVSADVRWTMDASVLFKPATLAGGGLDAVLESVGQFPRAQDMVVYHPDLDVVTPALLDGVYAHMGVDTPGQIISHASVADHYLHTLARASTPWVLVTS